MHSRVTLGWQGGASRTHVQRHWLRSRSCSHSSHTRHGMVRMCQAAGTAQRPSHRRPCHPSRHHKLLPSLMTASHRVMVTQITQINLVTRATLRFTWSVSMREGTRMSGQGGVCGQWVAAGPGRGCLRPVKQHTAGRGRRSRRKRRRRARCSRVCRRARRRHTAGMLRTGARAMCRRLSHMQGHSLASCHLSNRSVTSFTAQGTRNTHTCLVYPW